MESSLSLNRQSFLSKSLSSSSKYHVHLPADRSTKAFMCFLRVNFSSRVVLRSSTEPFGFTVVLLIDKVVGFFCKFLLK